MTEATHVSSDATKATLAASALSLGLLVFTIGGWLSIRQSVSANSGVIVLILFNIVVILGFLAMEARRRPYSLHLMHLLALFLFLGAAALFQYSSGVLGVAGPISGVRRQILPVLTAVSLWLGGYLVVYEGHQTLVKSARGPMVRFLERPVMTGRVTVVLVLAIVSLVYLGAVGLAGAATRGAVLESMREFASESGAGGYTSVWYMINLLLFRAFSLVALMAGLVVLFRERRSRTPLVYGLVLIVIVGVLLINNPFAAARMWLAITVIAFSAPFFLRRLRTGSTLVLIALGGIAFLPALHQSRYALSFDEWWNWFRIVSPLDYLSTSSDVDSLGMLTICQNWTEEFGHRWGMQMLGAALFWVPRTIWPSKPVETGAMVTDQLGFEFTNLAPPIMSDPLVDFGLVGVPFVAGLFGLLLARLDLTYWNGREASAPGVRVIDCIYPFWLGCVIFLTRGGLFASLTWTTSFTVWILLLAVGQRRTSHSESVPQSRERA